MRGTYPIVTCDHDSGCTEWMLDQWSACVDNWRDFLDGWQYDPFRYDEIACPAFCAEHATQWRAENPNHQPSRTGGDPS